MSDRIRATILFATAMLTGYCGAAQWHLASFCWAVLSLAIIYRFRR